MLIVVLKIIAALLAILGFAEPAHAEPISTAIGLTLLIEAGLGVSAVTAGVIGGALVSGAIAVGASLLSRVFTKSTTADGSPATDSGVQTALRVGADVPRNRIFGKQMLAGQLAYWNLFGPDNRWLQMVFVLGSGPHELFRMFGDGKPLTLGTPVDGAYPIMDYSYGTQPLGWVKFHNGYADQAVEGELVDSAVPAGRWAAENTGVGVCYAYVKLFYWPEVYKNGIPPFMFEVGARCYDPRKDGSNGGVGAHRWSDQHTWEWSDNPAVALYNYERGLFINGQRLLGRGVAPADMIRTMYIDAANVCDELVALKDGGTEKRYRLGINAGADRDLRSIEQEICIAMAGSLIEVAGAWGPLAGAAKDIVATLTDDDFVTGKQIRFSQKKPRDQLVNAMFGSYSDPAQNYQSVPYAPRTSSADEADDGDRFQVRRDYPQIQSQTQAQRVGEIERRDGRYQAAAGGTLPFKFSYIEAGDWVHWTSARRGFDSVFRVKSHRLSADQLIELSFDETSPAVFDFDVAIDELDPLNPGDLPGIGALISTVPDFAIGTVQLDGQGALTIPALVATWSPINDRTVDSVVVQYRVGTDDATAKVAPPFEPADGEGVITDGVQAGTSYQARAVITTTPVRPVFWTAWIPVVSAPLHVVPAALSSQPIGEITLQMFEAGLRDFVATQLGDEFHFSDFTEQNIANTTVEQEAANWLEIHVDQKEINTDIVRQISAVTGGYTYRGDYDATALYHANDMVRVSNGKLYTTNADVQGVAPPTAPWVEQLNVAVISQQWRNFAGTDGVAAATSDLIEARFQGVTVGTTPNDLPRSLAEIITDWAAFAGNDYSTAQSSDQIQANFYGTTLPGQANLVKSVATVHGEWNTFAGPTYAGATTTVNIESRFGVDGPLGTLPISVATLAQRWNTFAGGNYAAAQTSQQIKAMFGHDATGTLPRSLANIISDWQAFAGADYAAASTSNKIEARFVGGTVGSGPDAASNDNLMSVASVTNKWFAFAGGDNAAAQTSESIEARFGTGTLSKSVATILSEWTTFATATYAGASTLSTVNASIGANSANISTNASAIASVDGKLSATWQVKLDTNHYVSGLQLYNDGTSADFTVVTDVFRVAKPGVGGGGAVPVFEINTVGGISKIVFRGDMYADGTITSTKIAAGEVKAINVGTNRIVASAANIASLVVENLHIKNAQITVANFQVFPGGGVNPVGGVTCDLPITVFGVAGSTIILAVNGGFDFAGAGTTGSSSWSVTLVESGAAMDSGSAFFDAGDPPYLRVPIGGGTTFTASGSGNTLTARFTCSYGGGNAVAKNIRLSFAAYLR